MKRREGKPDYLIIAITFLLVIFGLTMLASASSDLAEKKFGDSYFYLKHQILNGLSFGLLGFFVTSKMHYKKYQKLAAPLLFLCIVFLILIFTPLGFSAGGADRWLKIGPAIFQPSELLKISFIIYMAAWLSNKQERKNDFLKGFLPFLIISGIVSFLLIIQPSTSTVAILLASALGIYFMSGAKLKFIFGTILVCLLGLALISAVTPYRMQRIMTFFQPEKNIQGTGFHLNQAQIAIGSGKIFGVGFGQSTTKLLFLPEPIGDSIFAVIAEEWGFIGAIMLIAAFLTLIIRGFILSRKINDEFGKLLLVGFSSLIAVQTFINIGAISGLLPLTGTPLPFISYGGTALAVFMTISGIMVNISKHA